MVIRLFFARPVISKDTYQHIVIGPWFPTHSLASVSHLRTEMAGLGRRPSDSLHGRLT